MRVRDRERLSHDSLCGLYDHQPVMPVLLSERVGPIYLLSTLHHPSKSTVPTWQPVILLHARTLMRVIIIIFELCWFDAKRLAYSSSHASLTCFHA